MSGPIEVHLGCGLEWVQETAVGWGLEPARGSGSFLGGCSILRCGLLSGFCDLFHFAGRARWAVRKSTNHAANTLKFEYPCPECNAKFSKPALLQRHQLVHTGQRRSFTCTSDLPVVIAVSTNSCHLRGLCANPIMSKLQAMDCMWHTIELYAAYNAM